MPDIRDRFPGINREWARFDGPAGTQMVDTAIDAVSAWMRSGNTAAAGGTFAAAQECSALLSSARATVARLLGARADGIVFGPNMTSLTLKFSRAVARTLQPGDRVLGTRLDHEANVSPWRIACEVSGAEHVMAPFDPIDGRLDPEQVIALIDERTRWVTVPGASNLIGTVPDLAPIVSAAHAAGARVFVDAVHLAPHRRIDIAALGCDALVTSPYKWYGPHSGVLYVAPDLVDSLPVAKVRPAANEGPSRWESGMPSFEAIAGVTAAAEYLMGEGMETIAAAETAVFAPLLQGLQSIEGVTVWGPRGLSGRVPTVAFTVRGLRPDEVARRLAADKVAVWDGHNYALEVVAQLGLESSGGVVRAGVVRYVDGEDVERLLRCVDAMAS